MREGQVLFTYLHLAADRPLTRELVDRNVTAIAYETVQTPDGALPLLAPMSEVAGRLAPQAGALPPDALGRRPRGPDRRRLGGVRRQGRGDRRRCLGDERSRDRTRHAGGGAAAGPRHQQAARGGPHLPGPPADRRLQLLRGRARRPGRRPGHRRGPCARRQGPHPDLQRPGLPDEARLGARRHRHRPGRLLRGLPAHHPRRPDVRRPRLDLLLRREHAGRRPAHLHLRPDQRHAALHRRAGGQGLAPGPRWGPLAGPGPQRARGHVTNAPVAEAHGCRTASLEDVLA